jgi:hypothetical protein
MLAATQNTGGPAPAKDHLVLELEHRPIGPDEVLLYYDGPQLMWLKTASSRYLAVALPQDAGRWPFLLVALTDTAQHALETGALSLRRAFTENGPVWVLPDYDAEVLRAHRIHPVPGDWLPGDVPLL